MNIPQLFVGHLTLTCPSLPFLSMPYRDMGLDVIETQTYSVSEPGDPLLRSWRKVLVGFCEGKNP